MKPGRSWHSSYTLDPPHLCWMLVENEKGEMKKKPSGRLKLHSGLQEGVCTMSDGQSRLRTLMLSPAVWDGERKAVLETVLNDVDPRHVWIYVGGDGEDRKVRSMMYYAARGGDCDVIGQFYSGQLARLEKKKTRSPLLIAANAYRLRATAFSYPQRFSYRAGHSQRNVRARWCNQRGAHRHTCSGTPTSTSHPCFIITQPNGVVWHSGPSRWCWTIVEAS